MTAAQSCAAEGGAYEPVVDYCEFGQ